MTRKFAQYEKATYIGLYTDGVGIESQTGTIQFAVRKAIIDTATAKFINLRDAQTKEVFVRSLPQGICEKPEDAEREWFRYAVFAHMTPKDALAIALDLGQHWQSAYIDRMCDQIVATERKSNAQVSQRFMEMRQEKIEAMQNRLEEFRLREIEAITYPQAAMIKRKADQVFSSTFR